MSSKLLFIYLIISFFFIIPDNAFSGTILIQGLPKVQFILEEQNVTISGHIEFVNLGDELALDVFPEIQIGSWQWIGKGHNLNPKQKRVWKLHEETPLSKLHCREKHCKNFQLNPIGVYPIEFYRHYNDMNGYPFSSMTIKYIFIGIEKGPFTLPLEGQLQVTSHGRSFTANLDLGNLSDENLKVAVAFRSTKAIAISKEQEKILDIDPHTNNIFTFYGETRKALLHSVHDIFAIVSSNIKPSTQTKNKETFRGLKILSSQYRVIKSKKTTYYWILGIIAAFIFSIFIVQINNEPQDM